MLDLIIKDEQKMSSLGEKLASLLQVGDVLALVGDLGTGKTFLSKAIGGALGVTENMSSPTYQIVHAYNLSCGQLVHADVYRLQNEEALYDIGFEEYLGGRHIVLIEWADLIKGFLLEEGNSVIWIKIQYAEFGRRVTIEIDDERRRALEVLYDPSN